MPPPGIQLGQLPRRHRTDWSVAVRRAIEHGVMHQDRDLISRELDVKLDHPEPIIKPPLECSQRIFRRQTPRTTMSNP